MICSDPAEIFQGVVIVTVPHMDDGVLGCGGTIAKFPNKERIYFIYVSDGVGSPAPVIPWLKDAVSPNISMIRMKESQAALAILGVPSENIYFLGLPTRRLGKYIGEIKSSLDSLFRQINPTHVLTPFRYDLHPDHVAVNRATRALARDSKFQSQLFEYFIYYKWRLLPKGDIRKYIPPNHLITIDIQSVADRKREALKCFKSQVTNFYHWQERPVLTQAVLDRFIQGPEVFFKSDLSLSNKAIFTLPTPLIRLAHTLERPLKKKKDQIQTLIRKVILRK